MFISPAFAQATESVAQQGSIQGTLLQLGLIFVIFYLLLIRPQQKKIKQHEVMLNAIKKGDKIITGGGIYAKVISADDVNDLTVEIANGVVVSLNRGTVREVINENPAPALKIKSKDEAKKNKAANSNKVK